RKNRLAFTSKTPGRTQLINFFELDADTYLVDLPGYGYAAVDRKTQGGWGMMVHDYLAAHRAPKGLLLLMDLRREAETEELALMAWLLENDLPFFPVLTKIDKLKPQARVKQLRCWRERLRLQGFGAEPLPVSALLKSGAPELWARVAFLLEERETPSE
ncbi:MAG: ribosome biogenesis GTP-binding protein YsxC, partial [Deltaproteobacteria bacterium]|nr:ribosome biogenesis GTP-binding protein YsxC [Deltaproteobacteria bacterium]